MGSRLLDVVIHHGGTFQGGPGGRRYTTNTDIEVYRDQDSDVLSCIVVRNLVKRAGYTDVENIYFQNVYGDFIVFGGDDVSRNCSMFLQENGELHLYVVHRQIHP